MCHHISLFSREKLEIDEGSSNRPDVPIAKVIQVKKTMSKKDIFIITLVIIAIALAIVAIFMSAFTYHQLSIAEKDELKSSALPAATSEFNIEELAKMLDNVSMRTSELEVQVEKLQETLDHTTDRLINASAEIATLKNKITMLENKTEKLDGELSSVTPALERLEIAKANRSEVDSLSRHFTILVSQKANQTELADLARNLTTLESTTVQITQFDIWVANITAEQREMDSRKADREEVAHLTEEFAKIAASALNASHNHLRSEIRMLAVNKTSQEDFDNLLSNFNSLENNTVRELLQLSASISELAASTVQLGQFNGTVANISGLHYSLDLLNSTLTTKADKVDVDALSDEIMELSASTVMNEDFEGLAQTVNTLATSKANVTELEELQETLDQTTDRLSNATVEIATLENGIATLDNELSSVNAGHNQLRTDVHMLAVNKTSQVEFDILLSNFSSLANNTVREGDFLQLSANVDEIAASTVKHEQLNNLATNVSNLECRLDTMNETLGTKADVTELHDLSTEVSALAATSVPREEFDRLSHNVTRLDETKVHLSELDQLLLDVSGLTSSVNTLSTTLETLSTHTTLLSDDIVQLSGNLSDLEETKASQSDLVSFSLQVDTLDNSTKADRLELTQHRTDLDSLLMSVRSLKYSKTNETSFRVLSGEIRSLNETVISLEDVTAMQVDVDHLSHTFDSFNNSFQELSIAAARKVDLDDLSHLVRAHGTLKANQTSFDGLSANVSQLAETAAKQRNLQALNRTLAAHTQSAETRVIRLSTKIDGIKEDFTHDIEQLQNTARDLSAPWLVVLLSLSLYYTCGHT